MGISRTNGWRLQDGQLWFGTSVRAFLSDRNKGIAWCDDARLAPFLVQEWCEILVEILVEGQDRASVRFGPQDAEPLGETALYRYTYQNQVGRSRLQITLQDGKVLPPALLLVLSPKYPTPVEYMTFFDRLLEDLTARAAHLPFQISAPTGWPVTESGRQPTPLFAYHFFRSFASDLCAAIETVLGAPHRALCDGEAVVALTQVTDIDAEVVDWIVSHLERPRHVPATSTMLIEGSFLPPAKVLQKPVSETFDTVPNRFVLHFLTEIENSLDDLLARVRQGKNGWEQVPERARRDLIDLRGTVTAARTDPLFDEVGAMDNFPASSTVLLGRDGYRDLLDLWRRFHLAQAPLFADLEAIIDARDAATLYEIWCFFALAERIGTVLGVSPELALLQDDVWGLRWGSKAAFPGSAEDLVYNGDFGRGARGSYSLALRPDFTLMLGGRPRVVFDAKFRFDDQELAAWESETPKEEETSPKDADRRPKRDDLYKMHTYRDALRCKAAVALYPGDRDVFYRVDSHSSDAIDWSTLLAGNLEGVGAVAMSPGLPGQLRSGRL